MSAAPVLLVDFGASRVKGALADPLRHEILARHEEPAPEPRWGVAGEVEVDPGSYAATLSRIVSALQAPSLPPASAIWLCTEMHGFLLDDGKGTPLTPYISWRDMRATLPSRSDEDPTLALLERQKGEAFFEITGMRLKSGLPFLGLAHLSRQGRLPANARFLTLPEWIAVSAGSHSGKVHTTSAAATGLFDIERAGWSEALLEACGATPAGLRLSVPTTNDGVELGVSTVAGKRLPLHGGYGDLQTALYGAGLPRRAKAAFNIGTGSQVARAVHARGLKAESRPYFAGGELAAITHIPSGRALNLFASLLDGLAQAAGGSAGVFWRVLAQLSFDEILNAPLQVDVNVFPGAWRYRGGGAIQGLLEGRASAEALVASVALAWLRQYGEALALIDPGAEEREVLLSGGLARRCPAAVVVLEVLTGRRMLSAEGEEDETLTGLARLAQGAS